jgi:predicted outer membrane repeat protein
MTFFRWQTALNADSKTAARDRRRGPRAQRRRFRPWADTLEERVVLSTPYFYPPVNSVTTLATYLSDANKCLESDGQTAVPLTDTGLEIDLEAPFSGPYTWATQSFDPSTNYVGFSLDIVNVDAGHVAIDLNSSEFLSIGANAGPVAINGGAGNNSITLEDGKAANGGAISYDGTFNSTSNPSPSLSITNVNFTDNSATSNGGAIYVEQGAGPLNVYSSTFGSQTITGNMAPSGKGGAIDYEGSSTLMVMNTNFVDNTAINGGAVEVGPQCANATMSICQFGTSYVNPPIVLPGQPPPQPQGNTATDHGGGIDYEGTLSSYLKLTNVTCRQNEALDGGAVYIGHGTGPVNVNSSNFGDILPYTGPFPPIFYSTDGNGATAGGAIYNVGASLLTINSTSFLVNSASGGDGGAIYSDSSGGLTINGNSVFDNNYTKGATGTSGMGGPGGAAAGGAIENLSGPLTITNSTFTGNSAEGGPGGIGSGSGSGGDGGNGTGGAIDFESASILNVSQGVMFTDNWAQGGGGGQAARGTTGNGGNGGNAYGGGVEVGNGAAMICATFTGNYAEGGGGGHSWSSGGIGGGGGTAYGGGVLIYMGTNTIIDSSTFTSNSVTGGGGGTAGNIQNGSVGGAYGGGLANYGNLNSYGDTFSSNTATGGTGGTGGGGEGVGGGVANVGNMNSLADTFDSNTAKGGTGATGVGGEGAGGGLANMGDLASDNDTFNTNTASGGAAATAGGDAFGGGVYASTASSNTNIQNGNFTDNSADGSNGGNGSGSGSGGQGGAAAGGGIENVTGVLAIANSGFTGNKAVGGNGGSGSGSGSGGNGGNGSGGAIDDQSANSLNLTAGLNFMNNEAEGGAGGKDPKGTTGSGGDGGNAYGGGVNLDNGTYDIEANFANNTAQGGNGGDSSSPGNGGNGEGGGLNNSNNGNLNITASTFENNTAAGGTGGNSTNPGGAGGAGGNAYGGGIDDQGIAFVGSWLSLTSNTATGGPGGAGPATGIGGLGGTAFGGGMFTSDSNPLAAVTNSNFGNSSVPGSGNSAIGGNGGGPTSSGTASGLAGRAYGGGLCNQDFLILNCDNFFDNLAQGGTGSRIIKGSINPNYGGGSGGGVYNGGNLGILTANNDTFTSNTAEGLGGTIGGFGGGIASESATVIANDLTFTNNSALTTGFGGAIGTYYGKFTLTNSTSTTGSVDIGISNPVPGNVGTGIYDNTSNTNWGTSAGNTVS